MMTSRKLVLGALALWLSAVSPAAHAAVAPVVASTPAGTALAATAPAAARTPTGAAPAATAPAVASTLTGAAKLAAIVAAKRATGQLTPTESFDKYKVLISGNIFVRDRRSIRTDDQTPTPMAKSLSPEEATVLRGIVHQLEVPGAPYVAYLENLQTGATVKVQMGDAVCQGKLANPSLDSVDYVKNGVAKRIAIGKTMAGTDAPAPAPPADTSSDTSANPSPSVGARSASTALPASAASIADQMRLKRLKDLGK